MIEMAVLFLEVDLPVYFEKWMRAISNPDQFLGRAFSPDAGLFHDALKFYVVITAATLVISGLMVVLARSRSVAIKAQMLAIGLLNLAFLFVGSAVAYFPMWLMGGKATFSGTLLSNIYSGGAYSPLLAGAQWILVAGIAPRWRHYILSPATAAAAVPYALADRDTDKVTYFVGSLIVLCLLGWAAYTTIRSLGFVHDLGGWRFVVAIILWLVISAPVFAIWKRITSMCYPSIEDTGPTQAPSFDSDQRSLTQSSNVTRLLSPPQ